MQAVFRSLVAARFFDTALSGPGILVTVRIVNVTVAISY